MPNLDQKGFAPVIIVGLVALGIAATAGTYFALKYTQSEEKPAITAQNPATVVTENLSVQEVKAANEETLLNIEGVEKVDVGEKDGKPCVVVFTFKETEETQNLENYKLNGYEVVVQNSAQNPPL